VTRILIAPDKFKGTLSAAEVAAHLGAGIRSVLPDAEVVAVPVADGGDGTLAAAEAAGFTRVPVEASGPTGMPCGTAFARRGTEAVVELAAISGLAQLPEGQLQPLTASSRGTGELVAAALEAGCRRIVVGIGGSACTDGGAGLVEALGARVLDASGSEVGPGGGALLDAARVDLSRLDPRLAEAEVVVACDVDNPLTGLRGAAAVYGPQKGATADQVALLDRALSHWADLVAVATGRDLREAPGAGAAGGVGFAAVAVLGASLRPGAELVFELSGFHDAVRGSDLVITGEGSLDEQTLHGKAPAAVAAVAQEAGVPVVAVAGQVTLSAAQQAAAGIRTAYALVDEAADPADAFARPGELLERIGARIAAALSAPDPASVTP
jgi:glycerate kinase